MTFERAQTLPVAEYQKWSPSENYRVDFEVYSDGALGVSVLDYLVGDALSAVLEPGSIDTVIDILLELKSNIKEDK